MTTPRLFLLCLLMTVNIFLVAQTTSTVNTFLKDGGAQVLSSLAHPTNEFLRAEWVHSDDGNRTKVTIVSKDSFWDNKETTIITLYRQGYFFSGVSVDYDSDSPEAFLALAIIKEFLNEQIREYNEEQQGTISAFEKYFNKSIIDMNGREISCIILTVSFMFSS